jgi:hypothetical protein
MTRTPSDLLDETLLMLHEAARLLTPAGDAKPVNYGTLVRWGLNGLKRPDGRKVRLEIFKIGGRMATTRQAINRFVDALNDREETATTMPRTSGRRQKAATRAGEALRRMGI